MLGAKRRLPVTGLKGQRVKAGNRSRKLDSLGLQNHIPREAARRELGLCKPGFSSAAGPTGHMAMVGTPETEKTDSISPSSSSQPPTMPFAGPRYTLPRSVSLGNQERGRKVFFVPFNVFDGFFSYCDGITLYTFLTVKLSPCHEIS